MPNIKEIALRLGLEIFDESPYDAGHVVDSGNKWIDDKLIEFSEALLAELAKGNEPVAIVGELSPATRAEVLNKGVLIGAYLYTLPPTASQIEQETAEACIRAVNDSYANGYMLLDAINDLCQGKWKEFKK